MANPYDSGKRSTIRLVEFSENDELVARVFSPRGSSPIALRLNGQDLSYAEIGKTFVDAISYHVDRETFSY